MSECMMKGDFDSGGLEVDELKYQHLATQLISMVSYLNDQSPGLQFCPYFRNMTRQPHFRNMQSSYYLVFVQPIGNTYFSYCKQRNIVHEVLTIRLGLHVRIKMPR